jgi:hypothetical protein
MLERAGERLGLLAFIDDEPASSSCGERVEQCPGCGKRLAIHNLLPKTHWGAMGTGLEGDGGSW